MYSQCLMSFIMIILINTNQQTIVLHIGALFNFDHDQYDLQAAQIAIDEINLRSYDLFNNRYTLTLLSNNSQVIRILFPIIDYIFLIFSVTLFMLLMLFFMQYFVAHNYCFLLVHHVQMKQKQLSKLRIIII